MKALVPQENIAHQILIIRSQKVMLDRDLARLFGVTTKRFNEAVKRNMKRFPQDFAFRLTQMEFQNLRSQIATSSSKHGGRRYLPLVFTEHGIAMLSGVLTSERAVMMNIQIIRTFIRVREIMITENNLRRKIEVLEKQCNEQFKIVFDALHRMIADDAEKPKIGFKKK